MIFRFKKAHFFFGGGALLGPIFVEPFLKKIDDLDKEIFVSGANEISKRPINAQSKPNLMYAYLIIGVLSAIIWLIFTVTYMFKRTNKPHESRENNNVNITELENKDIDKKEKSCSLNKPEPLRNKIKPHHKIIMILLTAIFTHTIYAVELSFGIMLPSYARISELKLDEKSSSYLNSLYWFTYTFFRLFCIVISNHISARSMLIIDLGLMMISNFVLLPLLFFKNEVFIWGSSALMGIINNY